MIRILQNWSFLFKFLTAVVWVQCLSITGMSNPMQRVAADITITVVDYKKSPLWGVNVYTDDLSFTGTTDEKGQIQMPDLTYSTPINFSYLGFKTLRLPHFRIKEMSGIVQLQHDTDLLPTIVVIGRRDERPADIPYQTASISKKEIAFFASQTPADALSQNENVFVQKSQMGGGSINIRGFEANKVLMVLDGVRMNNITYRKGHLQDAIKIGSPMLERIEVIYGPGALDYGSDALGGVVHFRTRDPLLMDDYESQENYKINTNAHLRYATANNEKTAHLDFNYGMRQWGVLTSLTYSDYGHLRAGAVRPKEYPWYGVRRSYVARDKYDYIVNQRDTNLQVPTAYGQFDLMQKIRYQPSRNQQFVLNFQFSRSTNIPRYDFLSDTVAGGDFSFADWYYGPQQRLLLSLKSLTFSNSKFFDKATLIVSAQKLDEDRYERKINKPLEYTIDDVYVFSATADFEKKMGESALTYGVDANHDKLFCDAGKIEIESGQRFGGKLTRYPSGGSNMTNLAGYASLKYQTPDSILSLFGGLRYTWTRLFTIYDQDDIDPIRWPDEFYEKGFLSTEGALTWSTGITLRSKNNWQFKAIGSSAFHAPNVDDMAKIRVKNNNVQVPNPDLKPESSQNWEVSIGKEIGSVQRKAGFNAYVEGVAYYTILNDVITKAFFQLPDGRTTFESDGDEYRVEANVNREKAFVAGTSGNLLLTLGKRWSLRSTIGYSYGRIIPEEDSLKNAGLFKWLKSESLEPLDHIPPLFGRTGLSYQTQKLRLDFVVRYNALKKWKDYRLNTEDNEEYAIPGVGAYAWTTYNLYSSYQISSAFSIDVALENILDFHYRPFSSGVSAAGRNLILTLKGKF